MISVRKEENIRTLHVFHSLDHQFFGYLWFYYFLTRSKYSHVSWNHNSHSYFTHERIWYLSTLSPYSWAVSSFFPLIALSLVTQSDLTVCDSMDCSPPGSSGHGILQERILEWVSISFSKESSQPRDRIQGSNPGLHIAGRFFTLWATRKALFIIIDYFK